MEKWECPIIIDFDDKKWYKNEKDSSEGKIWINNLLKKGDWVNIRIGFDTENFINLRNMKFSPNPEFYKWYEEVVEHFSKIVNLNQDLMQNIITLEEYKIESKALFQKLSEPEGLFFGYSKTFGDGIGMGKQAFEDIENAIRGLIKTSSVEDYKDIPNMILLFGEGIGPDKTSDFIAGIIYNHLVNYTKKTLKNRTGCEEMWVFKKDNKPEKIRIILVPEEITDAGVSRSNFSTDKEFHEAIEKYREPLQMLSQDIFKKVFIEGKNLGKADAMTIMKTGNSALIRLFLDNQDRQDQRRFLNNDIAIKQISSKAIQTLNISEENLTNFTIDSIYNYLINQYSWFSAIHQQLTNKVFCQIAVIITDSICFVESDNNLEEIKNKFDKFSSVPMKVVLIIEEKTRKTTIDKKLEEIKSFDSRIEIKIIKK